MIAFGGFRLDPLTRRLLSDTTGLPVPLGGRGFEALLYLASRPGVLVRKAELMAAIWPDVTVQDGSLNQCISTLRRVLGERPGDHSFIVTEPRRGYRFVAVVPQVAPRPGGSTRRRSDNAEAHQLYVSGWSALTRPGGGNLQRGLLQLERAVDIDSQFALAHACIAGAYALLGVFGLAPPRTVFPKARAAAVTALALDGGLAEAHAQLGHVQTMFDLDTVAADASYRRALALDPNSLMAHHYLGLQFIGAGRFEEALQHLRLAQAVEPLAANISANIGMTYYYAGRYREAIAQLEATLELDPQFAHAGALLGRCRLRLGDPDGALAEFARQSSATIGSAADVPAALALCGRRDEVRAQLDLLASSRAERYVSAFDIATVYAALGEASAALDWLETAADERAQPISALAVDPAFDALHDDPRFRRIIDGLGLYPPA